MWRELLGFAPHFALCVPASQAEFERVALCHTRSLLRVARRLTSSPSSAEDLVQDCLLLAWKNFGQFRPGTNARAWLFRILFNAFYASGRRLAHSSVPLTVDASTISPSLDQTMDVARALDSLPVDHRTVLLLGVVEGFTCGEISQILSVPIGTVMSRLARARRAMRARLARPQLTVKEA